MPAAVCIRALLAGNALSKFSCTHAIAASRRLFSTGDSWAEVEIGSGTVRFETGQYARLADGACVVSLGDTQVLATAVSDATFDETRDFLPLQVDYKDPSSASGQLPLTANRRDQSFIERETLCARAIDRALRPLFPPGFFFDTHVFAHVLSSDGQNDPDILAINAASAALTLSSIPFSGPVGAVRIGWVAGEWVVNPTTEQLVGSDMNLTYAGTADRALMVECIADQVSEKVVAMALRLAQKEAGKLVAPQLELARKLGVRKGSWQLLGTSPEALAAVRGVGAEVVERMMCEAEAGKHLRAGQMSDARRLVMRRLQEEGLLGAEGQDGKLKRGEVTWALEELERETLRRLALEGVRVDGRYLQRIRRVVCRSPALPHVVHGSALFERGDTQCMGSVTVASERWAQVGGSTSSKKPFMLHYSFPPFAVNEVGKAGAASRREVGHGNLAEKALTPVMPPEAEFPFTVRVVADTLMSNGSSSMAAVCAGSLALKDAGVPIKELVAGISIGLVTENYPLVMGGRVEGGAPGYCIPTMQEYGKEVLLTDIQGLEDHMGDMDFKVAGSSGGVTAMQLDTKLPGLRVESLVEALGAAKAGRRVLLEHMHAALKEGAPAEEGQPHYEPVTINQELIGRLVGPDGSNLLKIEETGGRLTVCDTGEIHIWAPTKAHWEAAAEGVRQVEGANLKEGEVYSVRVVRLLDHGAYVEVPGGMVTLLHISELSHHRIKGIRDVLMEGQVVDVKCMGKDARGMIRLSLKALTPAPVSKSTASSSSTPQNPPPA